MSELTLNDLKKCLDTANELGCILKWIEAFEKRQKSFLVPVNMGKWLSENSNAKTIGELFARFIKTKVLGDVKSKP